MWIVSYLGSLPRSRGALPGDREAILGTFGSGDHPARLAALTMLLGARVARGDVRVVPRGGAGARRDR